MFLSFQVGESKVRVDAGTGWLGRVSCGKRFTDDILRGGSVVGELDTYLFLQTALRNR